MHALDSDSEMPLTTLKKNEVNTYGMQDNTFKYQENDTLKSTTNMIEHTCNSLPIVYTKRLEEMEAFRLENLSPGRIIKYALEESKPKFQSMKHATNNISKDHWLQSYANFKYKLNIIFKRKERYCNKITYRKKDEATLELLYQIKPLSVVLTDFIKHPSKRLGITSDSSVMLHNDNSKEKINNNPKTFVFRVTNKHMVKIFHLNSKNDLHESYTISDYMFTTMLLERLKQRSLDLIENKFCCWVKLDQHVKEMGEQFINMYKEVQRMHSCPPTNCDCCSCSISCESKRDITLVSQLQNAVDLYIYIKSEITKQLELYEISKKTNDIYQYITCSLNDRMTVTKIKNIIKTNAENKTVIKKRICCWYNQKQFLDILRSQLPPSIVNFMKSRHECSLGCCECCCYETKHKTRKLKTFDSCISMNLPHSKNFTLSERINEKVYCANKKTLRFNSKRPQKKIIQPQLLPIMKHSLKITLHDNPHLAIDLNLVELVLKFTDKLLNKHALSFENDIHILDDCINNILNVFENILLTVEFNGKISAILKTPITGLPTSSLKIMAVVISCAQMQIEDNKMIFKLLSKHGIPMPNMPETSQLIIKKPIPYSFLYHNLPSCNLNDVNLRSFSCRMRKKRTMFKKSSNNYEMDIYNEDNLSHEVEGQLPIIEKTFSLKDLPDMPHTSDMNRSKEQDKSILHNLLSMPPNIDQLNTLYKESQKRKLSSNLNETKTSIHKVAHEKQKRKKIMTNNIRNIKTQEIEDKLNNSKGRNMVSFYSPPKANSNISSTPEFITRQNVASTSKHVNTVDETNEASKKCVFRAQSSNPKTFLSSKILIAYNFLEDLDIKEEYCIILDDNEETNI